MKKNLLYYATCLILCNSCGGEKTAAKDLTQFQKFILAQNIIRLPFHYDLVRQDFENCSKAAAQDSAFVNNTDYIIGLLPDTVDNFKLIYLTSGDDFYPALKVFDKKGKIISDNLICFPECSSGDCSFDSCSSLVEIKKEFITRTFKATITSCDSSGNKIKGTTKNKITTEQIFIDKSGKVTIKKN